MARRRRVALVWLITVVLVAATAAFWRRRSSAPERPDNIAPGDYSYAVGYAEFRIRQLMGRRHLPSTAVALVDDQTVVWQQAYGLADVENEIPATPETVYKMWSVSKVFTAIEIMRLVEEGLIELDAPVTDYLPEFAIQSRFADSAPITVRSILSHHAGLPRNGCHGQPSGPGTPDTLGLIVASLEDCHATYPVGRRYHYSNIGADLLGLLIQEIRGQPYAFYMQEHLLNRIGMQSSAFLSTGIPPHAHGALGYVRDKGNYVPLAQYDITGLPHGNLYASLADMIAFTQFVLADGKAHGEQMIAPETLRRMFRDQYSDTSDSQPMGLGWKLTRVLGDEMLVWHDGGPDEGIGSLVALLPDRKLGIVLIANAISFGGNVSVPMATDILLRMLEAKAGITPQVDQTQPSLERQTAQLEPYTGIYIAFGEPVDVGVKGGRLRLGARGLSVGLVATGATTFRFDHWLLRPALTDLFLPSIDPAALGVEFLTNDLSPGKWMFINIAGYAYEPCPRYPDIADTPDLWTELTGTYELRKRLPGGRADEGVIGSDVVEIEDGILTMPGVIGPLYTISETDLMILSGPFAGETMHYDPSTGYLYHQWIEYRPINED